MATNPQTDFDDDWNWSSDQNTTSPIAGAPSSVSWGHALTQTRTFTNNTSANDGGMARIGAEVRKPTSVSRGRGHLRKGDETQNIGGQPSNINQTTPPAGRPIVGRSFETAHPSNEISKSIFNFRTMASSLNQDLPVSASGDSSAPPSAPAVGFSFREAANAIDSYQSNSNDSPIGEWASTGEETTAFSMAVDHQVSGLENVLKNVAPLSGEDHKRKLASLRQNPNHPLYSVTTFESMNLKVELKRGLSADFKVKLSAIQEKTLPALNSPPYRNCIAQSQNGTGKTVAFVVTMLNRVDFSKDFVQALCLLPTKELAQQVVETTKKLGRFFENIDSSIYSAVRDSKPQLNSDGKVKAQIVIGTAGTVNTLMRKTKQLDFNGLEVFVVDEADKMLDYQSENFFTTIKNITGRLSQSTQRIFFSATFSDDVIRQAMEFMSDPLVIRLRDEELSLDNIRHFYMKVKSREEKLSAMKKIYNATVVGQCIVFCRTRQTSHWLCSQLREQLDFKVAELSGDMEPSERDEQISRFRRSADRVLVTTNVSARGLDIASVNLIINWDPPIHHDTKQADFDTYLHRVGRSGRFGAEGIAVNMIERDDEFRIFQQIEVHFGIEVKPLSQVYDEMEKTIRNRD